jgi:hypothetical protein
VLIAALIVLVLDVAAFLIVGMPSAEPGRDATFPADAIKKNLEPVAPHVVWPRATTPEGLIVFDVSISSMILTS